MTEIDSLRAEILSTIGSQQVLTSRLQAFEEAVRRQERRTALESMRSSLNTLRSLVAFLRQEVIECAGPLEKLCDELEKDALTETK